MVRDRSKLKAYMCTYAPLNSLILRFEDHQSTLFGVLQCYFGSIMEVTTYILSALFWKSKYPIFGLENNKEYNMESTTFLDVLNLRKWVPYMKSSNMYAHCTPHASNFTQNLCMHLKTLNFWLASQSNLQSFYVMCFFLWYMFCPFV